MPNILNFSIGLGPENIGLVLNAQLMDNIGKNHGPAITTNFVELGNGYYLLHYEDFPDDFKGSIKFYKHDAPDVILALGSVGPEEVKDLNEKIIKNISNTNLNSINNLKKKIFK